MARITFNTAFDYRTFDLFGGFQSATFQPDALQPDKQYVADTTGNFSFLIQGTGFSYGQNNQPSGGTVNQAAIYQTDALGVPIALAASVNDLNIPFAKQIQYLFSNPGDVIKDVFKGNDVINGSHSSDTIAGFGGRDTLTGRGGTDTFYFTEKPTETNFDVIKDFDKAGADKIALEDSIFKGVTKGNIDDVFVDITNKSIASGNNTLGDDAHILYNKNTGRLYYDADGNGKDGIDPITIAVLQQGPATKHPTLSSDDFLIV